MKRIQGFACLSVEKRKEIASIGGQSLRPEQRAFSQDRDLAKDAGRRGGLTPRARKPRMPKKPIPPSTVRVLVRREQRKAEQAQIEREGKTAPPLAIRPGFNSSPAPAWLKTRQWIEGEPSGDDTCKCGKPVMALKSYCAEHQART